jgi:hypothetical protein
MNQLSLSKQNIIYNGILIIIINKNVTTNLTYCLSSLKEIKLF